MIRRLPDWQKRLTPVLARAARTPCEHDCALFGADALAAMTGTDLAAPYRGRYRTLTGGLRLLRRDGHADQVALIAAHVPVRVGRPRPGDLAVVTTPDGPSVGVVQGAAVYVVGPLGAGLVPIDQAQTVFGVD